MNTQTPEQQTATLYGVFLQLCIVGLIPTATQLIEDVWGEHRRSEDEETTVQLRTLMMQLTFDQDGTELQHWTHAFGNDIEAFRTRARDVVLIHFRRLTD